MAHLRVYTRPCKLTHCPIEAGICLIILSFCCLHQHYHVFVKCSYVGDSSSSTEQKHFLQLHCFLCAALLVAYSWLALCIAHILPLPKKRERKSVCVLSALETSWPKWVCEKLYMCSDVCVYHLLLYLRHVPCIFFFISFFFLLFLLSLWLFIFFPVFSYLCRLVWISA